MKAALALASLGELLGRQPIDAVWLGAAEQRRLASFSSETRRQSYLAGRWLLRGQVAAELGVDRGAVSLEIDAQGRSSVSDHPGLFISISHTGPWVACALADAPIGIDIENARRPRGDVLALAAMVHGPAQCDELAALKGDARLRRFYQLWTLKEAALKRAGQGLDFERMRVMAFSAAADAGTADALSLELGDEGLLLALVGGPFLQTQTPALPAGVGVLQRLNLGDQSTPKSKKLFAAWAKKPATRTSCV